MKENCKTINLCYKCVIFFTSVTITAVKTAPTRMQNETFYILPCFYRTNHLISR